MLAKAVDAVVKIDAGGYPYVDSTIELYDYDKDIPLAKRGDKVKILVIRESWYMHIVLFIFSIVGVSAMGILAWYADKKRKENDN